MAIVEVGTMGVQPGKTPTEPSTPDGSILQNAWKAVTTASRGPARVYWGFEEEDASQMWGFFDWNSLEEHEAFAKSFGAEATAGFGQVFTPGFTKHAHFNTSVLRSPVAEVLLAFFPSTSSPSSRTTISHQFQAFKEKALDQCKGVRAVSSGWGLETDFPVRGSTDGEKGSLFFALIGWGSVDEHMAFRETEVCKENVGLLTGMEECVKLGMFHLRCEVMERAEKEEAAKQGVRTMQDG